MLIKMITYNHLYECSDWRDLYFKRHLNFSKPHSQEIASLMRSQQVLRYYKTVHLGSSPLRKIQLPGLCCASNLPLYAVYKTSYLKYCHYLTLSALSSLILRLVKYESSSGLIIIRISELLWIRKPHILTSRVE